MTQENQTTQWITPQREAIMHAKYGTSTHVSEIRVEMNALPGPPVPGVEAIRKIAGKMGLRRPAKHPATGRPISFLEEQKHDQEARGKQDPRYAKKKRKCLTCQRLFMSAHCGNRHCGCLPYIW